MRNLIEIKARITHRGACSGGCLPVFGNANETLAAWGAAVSLTHIPEILQATPWNPPQSTLMYRSIDALMRQIYCWVVYMFSKRT